MRKHTCNRCRKVEQIPTHQLVKFDASLHNLCSDCWEGFRSWFYAGDKVTRYAEITAEVTPEITEATDPTDDGNRAA